MTDPFDTVREEIARNYLYTPPEEVAQSRAAALAALASIEERLREAERLLEVERGSRVLGRILAEKAEAERDDERTGRHMAEDERGRLQHIIDCADTPLMRDVLRERDERLAVNVGLIAENTELKRKIARAALEPRAEA